MPVFNGQEYLENSIASILNQQYVNFEFLLLDDGSNDNTYKIMQHFRNHDDRIKIFKNNKNLGLTKSLNKLIYKSSGKFLARQDADDISLPDRFSKQLDFMFQKNIRVSTTRAYIKNSNKVIPGMSFYIPNKVAINYKNPFIHGTLMIERSLMFEYNCYNEEYTYSQDYELFYRMIKHGEKLLSLRTPLYVLSMENNISTMFKQDQKKFAKKVRSSIK